MRQWCVMVLCLTAWPAAAADTVQDEAEAFHAAAKVYQDSGRDKTAAIDVFQRFAERFPHSTRAADAYFAVGEAQLDRALVALDNDGVFARDPWNGRLPDTAVRAFQDAAAAYALALKKADDDGMRASAAYRLGEAAYDQRDWAQAAKQFEAVASQWPKSYVARKALLALASTRLAQEDFAGTSGVLRQLSEGFPESVGDPDISFMRGVLALHNGDYAEAQKAMSGQASERARYFLGRAYLLWQRPLLAATLFNRLSQDAKAEDLREASAFFLGDAFFLSKDYNGAIEKYQAFLRAYPFSRFKVAALYRVGASNFEKADYGEARLSFGSLVSQFPSDYYATLGRYFIGESYLAGGQMREALFSYSDVMANGRKDMQPQALYRLAWAQQSLGDHQRAVQSCELFLDSYPNHALAKYVYLVLGNNYARLGKDQQALAAYQRVLDVAPASDVAEQALFLTLKLQYDRKNFSSILTSYQYILRQLPQSLSKWRSLSSLTAAETYLRLNRVDEARVLYENILKVYPDEASAVYAQDGLAWCDELSGRHQEAVAARQKLKEMLRVEASSFSFAAVNDLGIADSFYAQKDYQDAFAFYDKFAGEHADSPAAPAALYRAGLALYRMKYYGQAIETWRKLAAQAPASPEARKACVQIADTLFRAQKYPEASAAYKKLLEDAPKGDQAPTATLRLAQIAYYGNDDEEALTRVKDLLLGFPQSSETSDALDLAEAVFDREPKRDFGAFLSGIVSEIPRSVVAGEVQFRLARRLYDRREYEGAARELEKFSVDYTDHPSLAKAQLLLGECYFHSEKYDGAAAAFDRYVQNFPQGDDVALALFRLGSAYYSQQLFDKAIAPYERVVSDFEKSEYLKPSLFNLALAYKAAGQADHAQATYARYAALAGGDESGLSARFEMAAIQRERKDWAGALKTLSEIAAAAKPGSDGALNAAYQQGEVAFAMGDKDAALKAWAALEASKPENNAYRLQALVKLSQIYEKDANWKQAISVYQDLATHAASTDMAAAARDRIKELQKLDPRSKE